MADSAGEQIIADWDRYGGVVEVANTIFTEARMADLARRIDAALAEARGDRPGAWDALDATRVAAIRARDELEAKLAEREAMVTALRARLEKADVHHLGGPAWPCRGDCPTCELLASTADAAARCIERARQEGAEEMRERCAREVVLLSGDGALGDAIRALDAGDPAARRGVRNG